MRFDYTTLRQGVFKGFVEIERIFWRISLGSGQEENPLVVYEIIKKFVLLLKLWLLKLERERIKKEALN